MLSRITFATVTISLLVSFYSCRELRFKNGKFTILQMTDLHYGDSADGDDKNVKIQEQLIERVKPDVVLATGDVISGYANDGSPNFQKNIWNKFTGPFYKYQVPYAFLMGNHDAFDGGLDPRKLIQLERASEYSLFREHLDRGFPDFTYYLPVHSSLKNDIVSSMLWVLNTNAIGCKGDLYSWGCMKERDVDWYRSTSKQIDAINGKNIHHLAFFHIPLPEYRNLYNEGYFYGTRDEAVCCPRVNTNAFQAFKEGNIQATFVGHDHNNDFGGWYDGIELVYGRKTGYGGYGPSVGPQGGRVIELTESLQEDGSIKVDRYHYVVLGNGEIDTLNSWFDNLVKKPNRSAQRSCPSLSSVSMRVQYVGVVCTLLNFLFI